MARASEGGATRTPLSRERVLHAAIVLADEGGIESLSMRKLADELGVKAMSLYNHIANKDDLLDGIVDAAWGEIVVPSGEADWKIGIREIAISAHETFLRHSGAPVLQVREMPGPARFRHGNALLECLRNSGFSEHLTHHEYYLTDSYTLGFMPQVLHYL